jgi:hypothetical protein
MKKIVIARRPDDGYTGDLARLLEKLFPECKVQIKCTEAEVLYEKPVLDWSLVTRD